jgi:hypothetical protein
MIEDENGLFQVEMKKDKSAQDIVNNLRIILDMKKVGTYLIATDCANYNGCELSIHGNAKKIAQQYDAITQSMIVNYPESIMRVMAAWDRRSKNE